MSLYTDLVAAGIKVSSHSSDLYFPVSDDSRKILSAYPIQKGNATVFTNQVEGGLWFDVPFAYEPWWEARTESAH